MKLTLLIFSCCLGLSTMMAQDSLSFDKVFVEQSVTESDTDVAAYSNIINNGGRRLALRWVRTVNDVPAGWNSAICDTNQCYLPTVDSADFNITANGTAPIIPHVYPDGTSGMANVTVKVYEIANPANSATAEFQFSSVSSTFVEAEIAFAVYPNPSTESFSIAAEADYTSISVYTLTGQRITSFPTRQDAYDVSQLPRGTVIISLEDRSGQSIGLKKLQLD